ncbi:unnamed protein product, partial [Sphacelaria rigidula]
ALDAVYASLKPQAPRIVVEVGGDRGGTSVVGPGPGACGLNAVPAAVMIKGKHPSRYLPANSLEALTVTCRAQYHTCSVLVPGLALDLFPHQHEGLQWMRDRERGRAPRLHPELFPLHPVRSEHGASPLDAGHPGASPPLGVTPEGQARSWQNRPVARRLWINVVDGMVWDKAPPPCRPVRGGMLCDEPGLGKTITVLALLLRTRGLLPAALPMPAASSSRGSTSPTDVWRHWGDMERQGAMVKVLRALQLEDPEGVFSRELDEETLRELGMVDYLDVVGDPIDLQAIARRTSSRTRRDAQPQYETFEQFASDVRRVFSNAILYHGATTGDFGQVRLNSSKVLFRRESPRARAIPGVAEAAKQLSKKAEELFKGAFVARRVVR